MAPGYFSTQNHQFYEAKMLFMPLSSASGSARIKSVLRSYLCSLCGSKCLLLPSKPEAWVGPSGLGCMTPGLAKNAQPQVVPYTKATLFRPLPGRPSLCLGKMVYEETGMTWRKKKSTSMSKSCSQDWQRVADLSGLRKV